MASLKISIRSSSAPFTSLTYVINARSNTESFGHVAVGVTEVHEIAIAAIGSNRPIFINLAIAVEKGPPDG